MSYPMRTLLLAAMLTLAAGRAGAASDGVVGQWLNQDGAGKVAISPCHDAPARICGAITWLKEPTEDGRPVHDLHNPNPSLRNRPVVGVLVIRDMKPDGPGRWTGGKLYDPETGHSYDGKLRARGGKLDVTGCVAFFCQTQVWTRAD